MHDLLLITCWDWLPLEIQEHITKIRASMHLNDIRKDSRKLDLHNEIHEYHTLLNAWSDGMTRKSNAHILCRLEKCTRHCPNKIRGRPWNNAFHTHMIIEGHFIDGELLSKDHVFLGHSFAHARSRLNHVKSFLFFA